ncbi:murein biosynthesis integral membrane protein MurJ [Nocardioides sp.]|uniref:murein biosynthesis integral membrane protein MurJ n=1 Tax=Nocardioides sp. TaxID=35761 RepID=UPI00260392EF|nr:murein biosynthesis integral membrane protein MurJ [Nocardioides sp.]
MNDRQDPAQPGKHQREGDDLTALRPILHAVQAAQAERDAQEARARLAGRQAGDDATAEHPIAYRIEQAYALALKHAESPEEQRVTQQAEQGAVMRNSAVMAAGTIFSRASGFIRAALLAAALGNTLHADVFNVANTIPNMLYILLAGGVINAVLVPQLVRSIKKDGDGGQAYTSRIITAAGTFLAVVTVLLIVAAPLVMRLFVSSDISGPAFDSTVDFARLCLPQVFFYGMFVLVGQILNAHGRFGPMMWAPIINNIISIAVLVLYLVVFGTATPDAAGYSAGQEWLLGLGSTVGIAAQFAVLVPYLHAAGVTLRPRWDLRGAGLGHTLRLGVWTVLFVLANQIAYFVVVRLSTNGSAAGGTGYTVYSTVFLIVMVPHAIVTVSLATAILPRLSAAAGENDQRRLARTLAPTLRTALAVMVPFAAVLLVVARPMAMVLLGYGSAKATVDNYVPTLMLFGGGVIAFTVHYLILRGFYAREENRIVFYIQCAVAATNIVVALVAVHFASAEHTAPALVIAYTASYVVGACLSYRVLNRRVGGLQTPLLVRFVIRLLAAVVAALAVSWVLITVVPWLHSDAGLIGSLIKGGIVGGVFGLVYIYAARALRISEVTSVISMLSRRVRR